MRVSRVITLAVVLVSLVAAGGNAAAQQSCPKGKLRLYTSWPMQGAMLPKGTGWKKAVDSAGSGATGAVPGTGPEAGTPDARSPQPGKWNAAVEGKNPTRPA